MKKRATDLYCVWDRSGGVWELRDGMSSADIEKLQIEIMKNIKIPPLDIMALILDHDKCSRHVIQKIYWYIRAITIELSGAIEVVLLRPELTVDQIEDLLMRCWSRDHTYVHAIGTLLNKAVNQKCRKSRAMIAKLLAPEHVSRLSGFDRDAVRMWAKKHKLKPARRVPGQPPKTRRLRDIKVLKPKEKFARY
ncbi:MAG: hypothetical protein K8S99_11200 [Planctomycetes bacterium]|nr:hypothetical protein [Planctomycetota bacterium]